MFGYVIGYIIGYAGICKGEDFSGADLHAALGDPEFGGLFAVGEVPLFFLGGTHHAPLWPPFSQMLTSKS